MRILLLNQFFYPDTAATSQLLTDLARELVTQGHEVVAICAQGDYASSRDLTALPSVTIIRSALLPFSHSPCGRLASYAGYFLTAAVQSLRGPAPDVVLTLTTPPLLSLVGTLVKRWRGGRRRSRRFPAPISPHQTHRCCCRLFTPSRRRNPRSRR